MLGWRVEKRILILKRLEQSPQSCGAPCSDAVFGRQYDRVGGVYTNVCAYAYIFRVSKWKCFHFYLNMDLSFSFNIPTTWLFQNYTTSDGYEAPSVMTVSQGPWRVINKINKTPRCEGLSHGSVNFLSRFLEAPKDIRRGCGIAWTFVCRTLWIIVQLQGFLLLE